MKCYFKFIAIFFCFIAQADATNAAKIQVSLVKIGSLKNDS